MPRSEDYRSGELRLRTAAWYGDRTIVLPVPDAWRIEVHAPRTSLPLTRAELRRRLESPLCRQPIRERTGSARRPLIIVDDLNRPTPAATVLPLVVKQLEDAGVARRSITIMVGPGTHAPPSPEAVAKKVGDDLIRSCRVLAHNSNARTVKIGRTSYGTPIFVPREVAESDFVIGVGGVYPNHTGGFGGGSKAALGILGTRSIAGLHFGHDSVGWGAAAEEDSFRRDLDEIARTIGLETSVLVAVDGERRIVDLACDDTLSSYSAFLDKHRGGFTAPRADPRARVVISNAYPSDLSLTFVLMKGMGPLAAAPPGASRVVVASCNEGLGFHGLFPFLNAPRGHRERMLWFRLAANANKPRRLARKGSVRLIRQLTGSGQAAAAAASEHPVWLYCPNSDALARLPGTIPGIRATSDWSEVLNGVAKEQDHGSSFLATVYTAAALQRLDPAAAG